MWHIEHIKKTLIYYFEHSILVNILSDKSFIRWKFRKEVGYTLNLKNPLSFNEKIQWLKFHEIHPEYSSLVDKELVKEFVKSKIVAAHVIKTINVWKTISDVNWDDLPNQFVLKSTADSGGVIVCKDKKHLNKEDAIKKLSKGLSQNYYKFYKEYPYKYLVPKIIAEEYIENKDGELVDYKFYCFNGEPKYILCASGRQKGDKRFDYFDLEWNHLPVHDKGCPGAYKIPQKPKNYERMIEIAQSLSEGLIHVRVDLYNVDGHIYFGEMTFFDGSGMSVYEPQEWDWIFGKYLKLPISNNE